MAQPADDFVRRNELRLYHVLVFKCNHHLVKHLLQKSKVYSCRHIYRPYSDSL